MLSSPVYAESHPRQLTSFLKVVPVPPSHCPPKSFNDTSLAAPHPLTPIESHPYKNHRGAGAFPTFQLSTVQTCNDPSFPFRGLRTLSFYVSRNPFACHSYENCRVYTNSSHFGTTPSIFSSFPLGSQRLRVRFSFPLRLSTVDCQLSTVSSAPFPSLPPAGRRRTLWSILTKP
jgi:hypothetical protein